MMTKKQWLLWSELQRLEATAQKRLGPQIGPCFPSSWFSWSWWFFGTLFLDTLLGNFSRKLFWDTFLGHRHLFAQKRLGLRIGLSLPSSWFPSSWWSFGALWHLSVQKQEKKKIPRTLSVLQESWNFYILVVSKWPLMENSGRGKSLNTESVKKQGHNAMPWSKNVTYADSQRPWRLNTAGGVTDFGKCLKKENVKIPFDCKKRHWRGAPNELSDV